MILGEDDLKNLLDCGKVVSFTQEARKRGRRCGGCLHQTFIIDEKHGSVACEACGENVSAFHALCSIAHSESLFRQRMGHLTRLREELKAYRPWLKAARAIESIWRGNKALPVCPHCNGALHPDDFQHVGRVSRQLEEQRRKAKT